MPDPVDRKVCQVVVSGDLVVDHHLYEGDRRKPDNANGRGVRHVRRVGGANGVRRLLEALGRQEKMLHEAEAKAAAAAKARSADLKPSDPRPEPTPIDCALGVVRPDLNPLHAAHHAFALWRPHKMTPAKDKENKQQVWRISGPKDTMGYGHEPIPPVAGTHVPEPQVPVHGMDVLVLDDAGSLFRKGTYRACWHLDGPVQPKWVLLKLSDPIAQGDLWHALVPAHADRLVVLVAAADLRREDVRISERLSWERTLEDLAAELDKPALEPLTQAAHLIVTFGGEAAVWIMRGRSEVAYFCFDAKAAEGDFAADHDGTVIGYMTCMAAAVAYGLTQSLGGNDEAFKAAMEAALESGLRGMRDLLYHGHGPVGTDPAGLPVLRLAAAMRGPATKQANFSRIDIPWPPPEEERGTWMIVESSQRPIGSAGPRSLVGLAGAVLRRGEQVYGRLPHLRFGNLVTAERSEIEALRGIRQLMLRYKRESAVKDRPKSIGVFGPPGAGKSFAVKEIAIDLFDNNAWLEFNLSQFDGARDLIGALHQVRDKVLADIIPVVFWDEFDSQNYLWLRSLLAPMQDGQFQEGQVTHPIGRAIFVFAGGTASNFAAFGPGDGEEEQKHWRLSKGPDFKSRLDAYYDVVGPNPRRLPGSVNTPTGALAGSWQRNRPAMSVRLDPADIGCPLRRALLIRGQLRYKDGAVLDIDPNLAAALLLVPEYLHGSRSMEKLAGPLGGRPGERLRRSALPPQDQIRMHVNPEAFADLLDRDASFTASAAIETLAKAIHDHWQRSAEAPGETKSQKFHRDWNALSEIEKEDNRAAARRIPSVLGLVGLGVTQDSRPRAPTPKVLSEHLKHNLERLAEAEHEGWQEFRERNGWRYDPVRDDAKLLHNLLVPYTALPHEEAKEKDRGSVRNFPKMVKDAGFRIVWLDDKT